MRMRFRLAGLVAAKLSAMAFLSVMVFAGAANAQALRSNVPQDMVWRTAFAEPGQMVAGFAGQGWHHDAPTFRVLRNNAGDGQDGDLQVEMAPVQAR